MDIHAPLAGPREVPPMMYPGLYRGVVVGVDRFAVPPHMLRIAVPTLTDFKGVWALPCWPTPASQRQFTAPVPGEGVWVMFEAADINYPVYIGFFGQEG